jgi:hypothetical protein
MSVSQIDRASNPRVSGASGRRSILQEGLVRGGVAARVARELREGLAMLAREGVSRTARHVRTIALIRLHNHFCDRRRVGDFVAGDLRAVIAQEGRAKVAFQGEHAAAVHCAPLPAKTLQWALDALDLAPDAYHFLDVGSGWGYSLAVAAERPFPRLTGIEFAGEFHDMAVANLGVIGRQGRLAPGRVTLRHESALNAELPAEPLVILLANPFGAEVMLPFLQRVEESHRANPREIVVVYANPVHAELFSRFQTRELKLGGRAGLLLRLASPYRVRAYRWGR